MIEKVDNVLRRTPYQGRYGARFQSHIFRVSELYGVEVNYEVAYHPELCWKTEEKQMTTIAHELKGKQ